MHGSRGKADKRAASNLAHLLLLRDGSPLRSEDSVLRWREIKFHAYGSVRLPVLRAKTDRPSQSPVLSLDPTAVEAPLDIRTHKGWSFCRRRWQCRSSDRFPVGSRRERSWQALVMTSTPTELEPGCPQGPNRARSELLDSLDLSPRDTKAVAIPENRR